MEGIKVLHTGDIHLGFEFEGDYEYREIRRRELKETFSYIVELCKRERVDVMLIAGDLFHGDCPSAELVSFVTDEFRKIEDVVVMIAPGNHDYYIKGSYYDRINTLCNNVFVFDGDMDYYEFNIREQLVRIYGAGFRSGVVRESLMKQRIIPKDMCITLGVFHGTVSGQKAKNNYNPISVKQIENNYFDYLALGHIHKQTEVLCAGRSHYAYCGCPEGLSFGTQGVKGIYMGMVYPGYADMHYIPTTKRIYAEMKYSVKEYTNNIELAKGIDNIIHDNYGDGYTDNVYRFVLEGNVSEEVKESICIHDIEKELTHVFRIELQDNTIVKDGFHSQKTAYDEDNKGAFIIKRIHIGAFGGLKDFTQSYSDGFNLIYGKNEYGKSTIMAFIRMMLYGCASKSKDISQNIRRKYEPFSGEKMCGSMECIFKGKDYLIDVEFGKTKGNDVRHVYDKMSGKEIVLPKEQEIGEYFLGINEGEFLKTMFEDNMGNYEDGDMQAGLMGHIANLSAGLPEADSGRRNSNEEIKRLDKEIEQLMSKRGTSGEIPQISRQIEEYRREVERLQEEKSHLQEDYRQNMHMEKRERKILEDLVEKMEELQESGKGDKGEYRINKIKYFLHFCITICLVMADIYMVFASNRYGWGKAGLAVLAVFTLIYGIKIIMDKVGMEKNKPYDRKLAEHIELIKQELGYEGYSVKELNKRIDEINRHLDSGNNIVNERIKQRIIKCEKRISELVDKRNRLRDMYDEKVNHRNQLVGQMEEISRTISEPIQDRAVELLNELTGEEYDGIMVNEQYQVKIKKKGMANFKEWKYLSTATTMQVYLALRIAMCEMMEENGVKVPILMDDILNYCDNERIERTIKVLRNLDRQVILLTCHVS